MTPLALRTSLLACATVCLVAGPVTGEPPPEPLAVLGRPAVPHFEEVHALALSPDGKTLALAGPDKKAGISLYDAPSGKRLLRIDVEDRPWVVFSPDGKLVAGVSRYLRDEAPASVRMWSVADGKQVLDVGLTGKRRITIAFSPDGKTFATGEEEGAVVIRDVGKGAVVAKLRTADKKEVTALVFSPDGKMLAAGTRGGEGSPGVVVGTARQGRPARPQPGRSARPGLCRGVDWRPGVFPGRQAGGLLARGVRPTC
jgi:WD40 repeat protein